MLARHPEANERVDVSSFKEALLGMPYMGDRFRFRTLPFLRPLEKLVNEIEFDLFRGKADFSGSKSTHGVMHERGPK